jgi:hypothetical protein
MVLLSFRASVDGQVLRTSARIVQDATAIKEPIEAFLSQLEKEDFELRPHPRRLKLMSPIH